MSNSNDVEGWHNCLNRKARKSNLQFYIMLTLLYKEAQMIPCQAKMVSEGKLTRHQTKMIRTMHGKKFKMWGMYTNKEISIRPNNLLRLCGRIYGSRS
ncbi:hypothetical protein ACJMK2_015793 [Sinanodonta woodiana]|uniref:Uncharacterized protein n=1 Tax=Sinanodonta woodiana TaxID=1069815 RepID=A0ABD3URS6_SINWO